jgi:chemotaxis protein MotB
MKKAIHSLAFLSLIIGLSFTSCVSNKKFAASEAKVDKLQKENASSMNKLIDCNGQVKNLTDEKAALQNANASVENDLKVLSTESKMTIADQAKRLKSLQNMIQAQKNVMTNLKNSIAEALLSREALKSLARVLNSTKDITVNIEGHTDNVPIKTKVFADNWDLSTARATSIVRILTTDNGFDPIRITASGRGSFHPVKPNETAEGRAANRRTEVILSPDLNELYKLLYQ